MRRLGEVNRERIALTGANTHSTQTWRGLMGTRLCGTKCGAISRQTDFEGITHLQGTPPGLGLDVEKNDAGSRAERVVGEMKRK